MHALSRHEAGENAAVGLAQSSDGRLGDPGHKPALCSADNAARRPLPRRTFLRHPSRRLGSDLDALFLDLRAPGGLCLSDSGVRRRLRNHPGVFTQGNLWLSGHGCGHGLHWVYRHERLGPPHVHRRDEFQRQYFLCSVHDGNRGSDGDQNLQLARHYVGRKD